MTLESKRNVVGALGFLFLGSLVAVSLIDASRHRVEEGRRAPVVPADSKGCVECHADTTPQLVEQWKASKHAEKGIACLACHGAKKEDPDGTMHFEARVTRIVTPKDCGACHKTEAEEMAKSPHGTPKPGLEVKLVRGEPDSKSWPLPLVGRVNPDGSAGSCNTCHGRHNFEVADAQQPSVCESCHLSDGSAEAWRRSPHGGYFLAAAAGQEPKAPSCVSCHMASTGQGSATHDVSSRVSWTLDAQGKPVRRGEAEARRNAMSDACGRCHGSSFIGDSFSRIDESFAAGRPSSAPPASFLALPAAWPHLSPADRLTLSKLQRK